MDRVKKVKKEVKRLETIFKTIDEDKFMTAKKLIQNAAFMSVQLEEMQERINVDGVTVEYQNGENQRGFKKSPDVETYNSFIKQYTTIINQLIGLLPSQTVKPTDLLAGLNKPK